MYSRLWAAIFCMFSVYALSGQIDILDKYNCNTWVQPSNDLCEDAIEITTASVNAVTCCGAIENNIDHCGNMETGIWYLYNQTGGGSVITVTNIDATGPINVEIFKGNCSGLELEAFSNCAQFETFTTTVPNCNGQILIHIATKREGCGAFNIKITDVAGCGAAEECEDIETADYLYPTSDAGEDCISSCLDFSCTSTCVDEGVWFRVDSDEFATLLNFEISNNDFEPLISVSTTGATVNCTDVDRLVICQPFVDGVLELDAAPDNVYYIEISSADGSVGTFDFCVSALSAPISCAETSLTMARPENPGADPNGPYCPGETVRFCYEITFTSGPQSSGNNCQYLQGIVPVLGGGWDLNVSSLDFQAPGGWNWFAEGQVDYNLESPVLAPAVNPDGNLALEYGPGGLSEGDLLPGGWWVVSTGTAPLCFPDGDPDNSFGLPIGCETSVTITHCFDLTTKSVADISDCSDEFSRDCSVSIFSFADGETGCWYAVACSADVPVTFKSTLDCSNLYDISASDAEICSGEFVDIPVEIIGGFEVPIEVKVISASNVSGANDWIFETGKGIIPDQIINTGTNIETVVYEATINTGSACVAPVIQFEVKVHPQLEIDVVTPVDICQGTAETLTAPLGYDTYQWYDVTNQLLGEENTIQVDTGGIYILVVTEGICAAKEEITVNASEPYTIDVLLDQDQEFCTNNDGTLSTTFDLTSLQDAGVTGQWFNGVTAIPIDDPTNVDFTIYDEPGIDGTVITYNFETNNAAVPCENITVSFSATLNACACPEFDALPINDQCAEGQVIDLANFYSSSMLGVWSISNAPGSTNITLIDEVVTVNEDADAGEYTLTYSIDDPSLGPLCETSWDITMNVGASAVADIITAVNACNADTGLDPVVVDLDDMFLSGAAGIWTTQETAVSINSDNEVSFVGITPGDLTFTYTTNTATDPCQNNTYDLIVSVIDCECEALDLDPMQDVCQGDLVFALNDLIVDAGNGVWTISSIIATDLPTIENNERLVFTETNDAVEYTLSYTLISTTLPPACATSVDFNFNIIEAPQSDITLASAVCNLDTGGDPDFLDLDDLFVSGSTGDWSTTETSLSIDGDNIVSFNGLAPGEYNFLFTTNDAVAPCENVGYAVVVTVQDCSCPSLVLGQQDDVCLENIDIDLATLIVDADPGDWSISGAGANPPVLDLAAGLMQISESTTPGEYILTYTLNGTNIPPSCGVEDQVIFNVVSPPVAEIITSTNVCNALTGNLPNTLDLDTLFISGAVGQWTFVNPELNLDGDNVVDFIDVPVGSYELYYTTAAAEMPCSEVTYTLTVNVSDCACPLLTVAPIADLCIADLDIELTNILTAPSAGIWEIAGQDVSSLSIENNETLALNAATAEGNYVLTYTLNDAASVPQGCAFDVSVSFDLFAPPSAEIIPTALACNLTGGAVPTNINLNEMFVSGSTGSWTTLETGITIDINNGVNFEGLTPGEYTFTYSTDIAQQPCVDQDYELVVTVADCSCPPIALNSAPDICSDGNAFDLNTVVVSGVGNGEWTFVDGPENVLIDPSGQFTYNGLMGGTYSFEFTLTDAVPMGCENSIQLDVAVFDPPSVNVTPEITVCNQLNGPSPSCIDLNALVAGDSGDWTVAPGFQGDFSDLSNVCFEGLAPGSQFEFVYTTNTAVAPCKDVPMSILVKVTDCSCPNLSLSIPVPICNMGGLIDLNDLETAETTDGNWSFVDGPETITLPSSDVFDADGVATGIYTFQFSPSFTPDATCEQFSTIEVEVFTSLSAGIGNVLNFCFGDTTLIDLPLLLNGADEGGFWDELSQVNSEDGAFDAMAGTFDLSNQIPGRYVFTYNHTSSVICPSVPAEVLVIINSLPLADAGDDFELTCAENTIELGGDDMVNGPRIEYLWSEESGLAIANPTAEKPIVTQPGVYTVEVTDNLFGCKSTDQIVISEDVNIPTFRADVLPMECEDNGTGGIIISNSIGGNGDYLYSIDGGGTWVDATLFDDLIPGSYDVMIQDGNGCESIVSGLVIPEPIILGVDAGEDAEVEFGENEFTLQLTTQASPDNIETVFWTEDGQVICEGTHDQCFTIDVDPIEESKYCVTVIDIFGCEETDCVILTEVIETNVYIANVFTPGQGGLNSQFFVQTDEKIELVKEFVIMDRWGESMFVAIPNHAPNDPAMGWDGTFNGKLVEQGVYVYYVVVEDVLGSTKKLKGEVTLLK